MRLITERLLIRFPTPEDLASSKLIWMDPFVRKFSGGAATSSQVEDGFKEDLRRKEEDFGFQSVTLKESNEHIGDCGLIKKKIENQDEIEIVYFFNKNYWGKGYATEAAQAVLGYGKDQLQINRIVALIHTENQASQKVARRLGLEFEKKVTTQSGNERDLFSIRF